MATPGWGWTSFTGKAPASGPALVHRDTPPREKAARAKNCSKRSVASRSSSSPVAISVWGMGRPSLETSSSKAPLSCRRTRVAKGEANTLAKRLTRSI